MATKVPTYRIDVPLDASSVPDRDSGRALKVAALNAQGAVVGSRIVKLDAKGQALASLDLPQAAGATRIVVAPEDVPDADLPGMQTLYANLPASRVPLDLVKLPTIRVSPYYWQLWLNWCRNFVVRGRLACADGSPIPGAVVNAYDVDAFWWWTSYQALGQATTDGNGEFTINFRWCCGLWPWWWWRLRDWSLDPDLVRRLGLHLQARPDLPLPPRPGPDPDPRIFDAWLNPASAPRTLSARGSSVALTPQASLSAAATATALTSLSTRAASVTLDLPHVGDPRQLGSLRDALLQRLPEPRDATLLRVWPWVTFEPWNDCSPDLVFRVTQSCGGEQKLIVNESRMDARWNVGTVTQVNLVASDAACCVGEVPDPLPHCSTPLGVCGILGSSIGGNTGAAMGPVGYYDPGNSDAPFAGTLRLEGDVGVDYYAFQLTRTPADGSSWLPVSPLAAGGFTRWYWDATTLTYVPVTFNFEMLDGQWVMESRAHYEATHFPGDWGTFHNHIWLTPDLTSLMHWITDGHYADGTWYLRLIGYDRTGDTLASRGVLPLCGTEDDTPPAPAQLVVTLDNQQPGTIDREPNADIVGLRINGAPADPCSMVDAQAGGMLDVDFIAYDIDAHLHSFSLVATWGKDMPPVNLLALPGATLTPLAMAGTPAADQVGPTYALAKAQAAPVDIAPAWRGGGMRLHIPDLHNAFPQTCCYQIELRVYNRTIVHCNNGLLQRDFSYYSLTVQV